MNEVHTHSHTGTHPHVQLATHTYPHSGLLRRCGFGHIISGWRLLAGFIFIAGASELLLHQQRSLLPTYGSSPAASSLPLVSTCCTLKKKSDFLAIQILKAF